MLSWKRKLIDPIGEVWTPFAFARVNGEWLDLNTTQFLHLRFRPRDHRPFYNASQLNFVDDKADALYGAVVPGVGVDYRYPFFANIRLRLDHRRADRADRRAPERSAWHRTRSSTSMRKASFSTSRPCSNGTNIPATTGSRPACRANYGGQFTLNFKNGAYVNVIGGQSYQVAGTNSYATPDAANVGLSSGLDTRLSDYVGASHHRAEPDASHSSPRAASTSIRWRRGASIWSAHIISAPGQAESNMQITSRSR